MLTNKSFAAAKPASDATLLMLEESGPHERTWMAFVAYDYIWDVSRRTSLSAATTLTEEWLGLYDTPSIMMQLYVVVFSREPLRLTYVRRDCLHVHTLQLSCKNG